MPISQTFNLVIMSILPLHFQATPAVLWCGLKKHTYSVSPLRNYVCLLLGSKTDPDHGNQSTGVIVTNLVFNCHYFPPLTLTRTWALRPRTRIPSPRT